MVKIAIVEDEENHILEIKDYLKRYEEESGEKCSVSVYGDGDGIVSRYKGQFDIILMDIQMKFVDGMTAAARCWIPFWKISWPTHGSIRSS